MHIHHACVLPSTCYSIVACLSVDRVTKSTWSEIPVGRGLTESVFDSKCQRKFHCYKHS